MQLFNKKVLIIGAARSGLATAQFLLKLGAQVFLNDLKTREEMTVQGLDDLEKQGMTLILGVHPDVEVLNIDLIIMSPGVPLTIPPVVTAQERGIPLWSEMELASYYTKALMVAVTGTNGKTTTTSLIGQIFNDAGYNVFVGGNIGVPFISKAKELQEKDIAVLEASSFQLELTERFRPRISLILNLTPDHLDRHGTFSGYVGAKEKIFANQGAGDWLILNYDDEETKKLADLAHCQVIFFSRRHILEEGFMVLDGYLSAVFKGKITPIIKPEEIFIKGGHNLENALAAVAASWVMGVDPKSIAASLRVFPGVPHRLEQVITIKGVEYINDSKGTNPDASIKALEAYDKPIVLIAGGKSKGSDFLPFAHIVKERVKAVVLVGQAAGDIEDSLREAGFVNYFYADSFEGAVRKGGDLAEKGDIVLLSPACASFDMFENYEQRGDVFKDIVKSMASFAN